MAASSRPVGPQFLRAIVLLQFADNESSQGESWLCLSMVAAEGGLSGARRAVILPFSPSQRLPGRQVGLRHRGYSSDCLEASSELPFRKRHRPNLWPMPIRSTMRPGRQPDSFLSAPAFHTASGFATVASSQFRTSMPQPRFSSAMSCAQQARPKSFQEAKSVAQSRETDLITLGLKMHLSTASASFQNVPAMVTTILTRPRRYRQGCHVADWRHRGQR